MPALSWKLPSGSCSIFVRTIAINDLYHFSEMIFPSAQFILRSTIAWRAAPTCWSGLERMERREGKRHLQL